MRTDVNAEHILELNRRFHDEVEAEHYDNRMAVDHGPEAVRRMIAELERTLGAPLPRSGKVVDVASGTGNIAVKLAKTGWWDEVVAVDISANSLSKASAHAAQEGCALTTVVSDMQTLPFEDNSVELLVGCAFMHHLPDPKAFMAEALRVLKPGAPVIIIGEPTHFGERSVEFVKTPLVLLNAALRSAKSRASGEDVFTWDHANIDVHQFTQADAKSFVEGFEQPRIMTEGFLSPIMDLALFTPIRFALGENRVVKTVFWSLNGLFGAVDRALLDHVLPKGAKVCLKLSGRKPVL